MRNILRFMKGLEGYVVLIFLLLIAQARCDLSLPAYTSSILNTGLQQKGIEQAAAGNLPEKAGYIRRRQRIKESEIEKARRPPGFLRPSSYQNPSRSRCFLSACLLFPLSHSISSFGPSTIRPGTS